MLRFLKNKPSRKSLLCLAALGAVMTFTAKANADEKFVYLTNWFAEAEHGGFYQALATGLYKKYGLDVTIKMGGPQVNIIQLMAAGQADCVMGSSDLQMIQIREGGVPVVNVAAAMQKDPQVLIAHDDVTSLEGLKGKTILIAQSAHKGYWPWLKASTASPMNKLGPTPSTFSPSWPIKTWPNKATSPLSPLPFKKQA